jgi:hypothetical protein
VCSATDPGLRQNLVEELARQLYLRPREIEEHGRRIVRGGPSSQPAQRTPMPPGERELARILLDCTDAWRQKILEVVYTEYIEDSRIRRLLEDAGEIREIDAEGDFVNELLGRCTDPETSSLVAELCTSPMPEITDESIRVHLETLLQHQARERSRRLAPLIAAAEKRGDNAELDRLLAEKARLRQEFAEI